MPVKTKESDTMPLNGRQFTRNGSRPTWEIATLFPAQGEWTEDDLFELEDRYGAYPLRELVDGWLEILPMATELHQMILIYFFDLLRAFANAHAPGTVLTSGARMRLGPKKREGSIREPDVLYMKAENDHRRHQKYWDGADLVMEVVSGSPEDRKRDLVEKRKHYAKANIPEYWIIDPEDECIRVFTPRRGKYHLHGKFGLGKTATSVLLPGFSVSVTEALNRPGSAAD